MSSLIFGPVGSVDLFGGEPLPPDLGGYPEESIPSPAPESVRALATRIASLLFAAGIPGDMVGVGGSPSTKHVVVLGRRLDQIPASVLRLVGADTDGASVSVEVLGLTKSQAQEFKTWTPVTRSSAQYGALTIPAVRFTIRRAGALFGYDRC
jgi:hypothetical protein